MARDKTAFQPMLAESLPFLEDDITVDLSSIPLPRLVSTKLDGIRCHIGEDTTPLTRKLKRIQNDHVAAELSTWALPGLDGELTVGNPFGWDCINRATSGINSEDGEPDWHFHVFDWSGDKGRPFHERLEVARELVRQIGHPRISIVEHVHMTNADDIHKFARDCVDRQFEGAMLRDPMGPYKYGRSTVREGWLLKYKLWNDREARIVGYVEKTKNTNALEADERGYAKRSKKKDGMVGAGTLGTLRCILPENGIEFEIGTGFDDAERARLWKTSMIGKLVNFKHQGYTPDGKPRFPSYRYIREDI